jgi:hypothetical protein
VAAGTATARIFASRVAGRRSPNLAGAIYGTIVATAVVAGIDKSTSLSAVRAFWLLLASGVFFWAAHVYANLVAERIRGHHRMRRQDIGRVMSREWPLLQSSLPLAVPLALGWSGVIDRETALVTATVVGVAMLAAWGVNFARREGYTLAGIVGCAAVNATVGLLIIGLKVAVP